MILKALKTNIIRPGEDIVEAILKAVENEKIDLEDGDLIAVSSKVLAVSQRRVVKVSDVTPSKKAENLAETFKLDSRYVEVVLEESEAVYGGVYRSLLTLKDGSLIANAGVDQKNAPPGYVVLLPNDPVSTSEEIRRELRNKAGKNVGVIVVDSHVTPLRMGTVGYALAVSGFKAIEDHRFKSDLFGREIKITRHSLADDLAGAAHTLMGESDERVPIVLIRDAPVELTEENFSSFLTINREECLFASVFLQHSE